MREPVDLEEDHAGHRGLRSAAAPAGDAPGDAKLVLVVVVGPEEHAEHHGGGGDDERGEQRVAERRDADPVGQQVGGQEQQRRVEEQDRQEAGGDRERKAQGRHDGRHDHVEHRDHHGHDERRTGAIEGDAGNERGRDVDRPRHDRHAQQQAPQPDPRRHRLPGRALTVCGVGLDRHRLIVGAHGGTRWMWPYSMGGTIARAGDAVLTRIG